MNSRQVCNVFTISQKQIKDEVDFLHVDKHLSFVQVDFNTGYQSFLQGDIIIIDGHDQAFSEYSK